MALYKLDYYYYFLRLVGPTPFPREPIIIIIIIIIIRLMHL